MTARGAHHAAMCVAANDENDVALLRMELPVPNGLGSLRLGAANSGSAGTPVLAVGNPYDWDLEAPSGAKPRHNGYTPFWVSGGRVHA